MLPSALLKVPVVWCPKIKELVKFVIPDTASDKPSIADAPPPLASSQLISVPSEVNT